MWNKTVIIVLCTLVVCSVAVVSWTINDRKVPETGDLCLTPACIHAASRILMSMNSSVKPCDDFYEFACGNYADSVSIAKDSFMTDPILEARRNVISRLQQLIEDIDQSNAPKHFRVVKMYYEQCLNDPSIWTNITAQMNSGMEHIARENGWPLKELESWNVTKFDYSHTTSSLLYKGIAIDKDNATAVIPNLDESEPSIDRHYLQEGFSNEVVQAYYRYMVDIGVALGFNETVAKLDMNETLSLEIELYQKVFTKHDEIDLSRRYSKTTLVELQEKYPISSLNSSGLLPNLVIQLEFDDETMDRAMKWMSEKSKRALANWAAWRIIAKKIPEFKSYFTQRYSAFQRIIEGIGSEECVRKTEESLGFALIALYQRKYISQSSVDDMTVMLGNLKEQFSGLIQKAEWLDSDTRKKAFEKVSNLKSSFVTCGEPIRDDELEAFYSELKLSNGSFQDIRRIVDNFYFMKPRSAWILPNRSYCGVLWLLTSYDRKYNFIQMGAYEFSGFFHDIDRPKYLNYGISARTIGHEMGHSLDFASININKNGITEAWSNSESKEHYMNRAQCFLDQFQNYTIPGSKIHLNGYLTLNENIADYTGTKIAYQAYVKWASTRLPEKRLPELAYSPNQMYWIAMANSWCIKYRPQILKTLVYEDEHSLNKYRINGPLANLQEFSNDFGCDSGTRMNPDNKCHLW